MNKKKVTIIVGVVIAVVIIGATAYFMFSSMNSTDSAKDNSELANEIAPYLPDYTTDEIKEIISNLSPIQPPAPLAQPA